MKTFKVILLLAAVYIFSSVSSFAFEKKEKKCNAIWDPFCTGWASGDPAKKSTSSKSESTKKTGKAKKKVSGFFKKLKEMGGKNVGEEG